MKLIHVVWLASFSIVFSYCSKKIEPYITASSAGQLGFYTITEAGPKLMNGLELNYINGYTDKRSYAPGDSITFYLSGPKPGNITLPVNNANDQVVFTISVNLTTQTDSKIKPWVDGFGYAATLTTTLPSNLKPGVYYVNNMIWRNGSIPFVCKDLLSRHDITIVYPSNTINAYNWTGGKSLYHPDFANRSTVVSFLRPLKLSLSTSGSGFNKWMTTQTFDANYIVDEDLENFDEIGNSKLLIIIGHSEYWTRQARENVDEFIASGKNVLVLSGNTMWWQVRYKPENDLMICYKDEQLDPFTNTLFKTITWDQPQLNYSIIQSLGADFSNGGFGDRLIKRMNGYRIVKANSPLFENTGLKNGDTLNLPTHEYDGAPLVKMILPGSNEIPEIDVTKLNGYRVELLGYDFATLGPKHTMGTFIVFQKNQASGTVVNVASTAWCAEANFNGPHQDVFQQITKNMINKSLANTSLFAK